MTAPMEGHPLITVVRRRNWTAASYLHRVAVQHQALGYGVLAARKEKFTRWTRPPRSGGPAPIPALSTQLAMAAVLRVEPSEVHRRGWPDWLLLAVDDDRVILESPWSGASTVKALDEVGGPMDRRGFLIASSNALPPLLAQWATAAPAAGAVGRGRRIGRDVPELCEARLDALRHLDDQLGAAATYDAATAELRLITGLLRRAGYTEDTGRRLYTLACEASRIAGWCAYDTGHLAAAERHFITGLRAAASGGDSTAAADTLAFWANLRYTSGDPYGALSLLDAGLADRRRVTSPRVLTMLHLRRARAHSLAGQPAGAYRAVDAALAAYDTAGPARQDLPSMYWITAGEIFQIAGSAALTLDDPRRALAYFGTARTHPDPYTPHEARGEAIYLARQGRAHLALGDLDGAVHTGYEVVDLMGGVDSARGSHALGELRAALAPHRAHPDVADLLARSAPVAA